MIALVMGIPFLWAGLGYASWILLAFRVCGSFPGSACSGYLELALFLPVLLIVWGLVDLPICTRCREIAAKVGDRRFGRPRRRPWPGWSSDSCLAGS